MEAYRFIGQYHEEFGVRWLLRRLGICPNAYYNYRKHRKADYYAQKAEVRKKIEDIYHKHNGVDGYRSMTVYPEANVLSRLSFLTPSPNHVASFFHAPLTYYSAKIQDFIGGTIMKPYNQIQIKLSSLIIKQLRCSKHMIY